MEGSGSCWTAVDTVDDGVVKGKEMVFIHVKSSQYSILLPRWHFLRISSALEENLRRLWKVVPKYLLLHRLPMDGGSPSD